jgi:hypothetical protein
MIHGVETLDLESAKKAWVKMQVSSTPIISNQILD